MDVTYGLILANILAYVVATMVQQYWPAPIFPLLGFVPARMIGDYALFSGADTLPWGVTLLSYQFVHVNIFHVAFNMVFLHGFGHAVERALGAKRFILFYLMCGVLAAGTYALASGPVPIPLIGASGAVSGLLGASLALFPTAQIRLWLVITSVSIRAFWFLLGWLILQFVHIVISGGDGDVAWTAHIGGFMVGVSAVWLFTRSPHN